MNSDAFVRAILETGVSSHQVVKYQSGKKYRVTSVVHEKTWPCRDCPDDGKVTFYDITAECDDKDCTVLSYSYCSANFFYYSELQGRHFIRIR